MAELDDLKHRLRDFALARDWEQFHTPKNLAMALVAEAAEVVEHFQWLTAAESQALDPSKRAEVALEMADVLLYLVMLADQLEVDLADVAHHKINLNEKRFPPPPRPQERL
ncbi:MAG: nucleotide pyrophosphohydrolase [Gammaproteobacteria bacterium]|nr:nucleotide pyrophosphohydrolase [Gammaproteobacteria bacterium]